MTSSRLATVLHHDHLETSFAGIVHPISTPESLVQQFRGIKYASVPGRFRQSTLCTSYPANTDATKYGPICPQVKHRSIEEELFGLPENETPQQIFKHDEFECLNLNITRPGGATPESHLPVMLWIHGGGHRGCGSSWVFDGGALVRKSMKSNSPVIIVSINYRLGLFGFAANAAIREDNKQAGSEGVGNYGLRDQRKAMEWVHHFIGDFGGDPSNVTVFGQGSGAADIVHHLHSTANQKNPLFHRAIIQSALVDHNVPDVATSGWHLSRILSQLHVSSLPQLRALEPEQLVYLGQNLRAVDDGVFFNKDWRESLSPRENAHRRGHHYLGHPRIHAHKSKSRSPHPHSTSAHQTHLNSTASRVLQPLIIGDCAFDSFLWSLPASMWTATAVERRLKAICGSLHKASALLRAYDISSCTPSEELPERVLELINDARIAWPTQEVFDSAKFERGGHDVWRYVFDQEGPARGIPHHATDLMYLFDNAPVPATQPLVPQIEDDDEEDMFDCGFDDGWAMPVDDEFGYGRVRDVMQERWIAFAHGEIPWKEDKVFVFGPEGETGERSSCIFEGRRRKHMWEEALEPLGEHLVQKIGVELSNGPPITGS